MKNRIECYITENRVLSDQYFVLSVSSPELARVCFPGHFCELKATCPSQHRKLYKPISVYAVEDDKVSFMIKAIGLGTIALRDLNPGDTLSVIGPLGNTFPEMIDKRVILVSGGVGYPPLAFFKKVYGSSNRITHIHGGGSCGDVFPADACYTLDGSAGEKGLVTDGLQRELMDKQAACILSCGPLAMVKAVQDIACEYNVEHLASLEAYMACGIGVCHGCSIPYGSTGYLRVCVEGPVFDAYNIRWSEI